MNFKSKTVGVIITVIAIALMISIAIFIGGPLTRFVSQPERFRAWVDSHGPFSKLAFILMVFFQVVIAIVPGEPFEIGAGYAFGAIEGTILCEIGILLGTLVIFLLVRRFGIKLVNLFFSGKEIKTLGFLKNNKKRELLILLIFIFPGTPKDLLSYFVGLTDIKLKNWLAITFITRIPSVVTSTVGGDALGTKKYIFAIIVFAITLAISLIGYFIYHKFSTKSANSKQGE